MKLILLIIFVFAFTGCLPEQEVRTEAGGSTSTSTDEPEEISGGLFGTPIMWLNSGLSSEILTINVDNQKSIYLLGDQVHNYLLDSDNFKGSYCLEIKFPQSANTSPKRLRVKVTPQFSNNFNIGQTTRFFLVNLSSEFGNDFCNKSSVEIVNGKEVTISANDSNYNGIVDGSDISYVLKSADVCVGCLNVLSSSEVVLYKLDSSTNLLNRTSASLINYKDLTLRIDNNSNSDSGQSSCLNSDCVALGFDCCQQGQCISEKNIKTSGVNVDPVGFATAEQEKFTDAQWYKKYPQFYYACLEKPPEDDIEPTPPDPVDPVGDADERFKELLADFECVEELKTNSISDPFHKNPVNGGATYSKCDVSTTSVTNYYKTVMLRMYENCGCSEKTDLDKMVSNCPSYTYEPIYQVDGSGNQTTTVLALNCKVPPNDQTPLPFQNLEVIVNSKSAPHRFFDTNNIEINPMESLPSGATGIQEGEAFQYLDDFYIFPKNGTYNMNSIIGQMNVQLNQAHPAFKIDIEFDKQYIIGTKSGFFQPCPTCAKDSWFNNFSAFPFASTGVGVQAIGYTTRRDTFGTNSTLGNYEDTNFSRACFIPPTMLPFGHLEDANNQTQRLNRLKAQAALFINGYQRDWYGFNKGALIGSFDGVTWFAVGKGRIVKSTSNVLYLAINTPFADLTSPTNHIVSVQEYDFTSTAPIFDYDPNEPINSAVQNEAASCQEHHECETDSHCITKLGWEYVCADVSYNKTSWPEFEVDGAREIANTKRTGSIIDFLQQATLPPNTSSKKCVYRGAGSPCRVDYDSITDEALRKNLTCAPNFYCANISSTNSFNHEVSRFGRPLDELVESKNHLFGQDANILGRPKHYTNTGNLGSLPSDIRSALEANLLLTDPTGAGNFGLCRPGKLLPSYASAIDTNDWQQTSQHKAPDAQFRTDYISQIGSCNSTLYTDLRYSSCPMLDEDGNYIHTQDTYLNDNFIIPSITAPQAQKFVTERYSFAQNSCGLESLSSSALPTITSTGADLDAFSAFKTIEGDPLSSSNIVFEQSLARDSCLRKAGAVCHTDLDCSPNRLQANVIDLVPLSYFGNNAEKNYYEEFLVCGQARSEPQVGDSDYFTYNIHNNKCCRPVGSTLTMFTEDSPSPNALDSIGIDTSVYGSLNPTDVKRYSRYSVVDSTINSLTKKSNIIRPSANTADSDNNKLIDNSINITNQNQWKTIHTAAAKTCCGGSWVRKFEDGTNDWSKNRLSINPTNFKCINNRSPLFLTENAPAFGLDQNQLEQDRIDFCYDGAQKEGGCIQDRTIGQINSFTLTKPRLNTVDLIPTKTFNMTLDSSLPNMEDEWANNLWVFNRFIPYVGGEGINDRGYVLEWSDINAAETTEIDEATKNIITRIPTFITFDSVSELNIRLTNPNPDAAIDPRAEIACTDAQTTTDPLPLPGGYLFDDDCDPAKLDSAGGLCGKSDEWYTETGTDTNGDTSLFSKICPEDGNPLTLNCCYVYNPTTRILRVAFSNDDNADANNFEKKDVSVKVDFTAVGTLAWEKRKTSATTVSDVSVIDHRRSSSPGNALYYLKKLAKLEYLGIPQMTYEPIYCNDNYQKMVPGIFKEDAFGQSLKTVMDFINHDRTFYDSGVGTPWQSDSSVAAPYNADSLNQNLVGTQELIDHSPIFSDNQFQCCMELGTAIDKNEPSTVCCSGTAVEDEADDTKKICKLPAGTNLNVYFNKFVSGEGLSTSLDAPLTEDDFNNKTGEPETNNNVLAKLRALGEDYCVGGTVRTGGAFGGFQAQPIGTQGSKAELIFSIIDSPSDNDNDSEPNTGYDIFDQGFKWDHQVYCDSGEG